MEPTEATWPDCVSDGNVFESRTLSYPGRTWQDTLTICLRHSESKKEAA